MKLKLIPFISSLLACLVLVSCGPKKPKPDENDFAKAQESLCDGIKGVAYNIPPPSEIPYLLQATGAEFNQSLINDRKKADGYASQNDKASLNLGVYAADIGYLSSYEKTQEVIDYFNVCKGIADKLGVSAAFNQNTLKRIESNIGNKDSLAAILNDEVKKINSYLVDDNRCKLGALLVAGSFVESLFISTGIVKSYPKNILPDDSKNLVLTPLMRIILDQKKSVSEVTRLLSSVEQTGAIPSLLTDFKSLEASYAKLNIEEKIKTGKANTALSDKDLIDITVVVEKLRGDIVN